MPKEKLSKNGDGITELYRLYRPATFDEIVGQEETVATLTKLLKKGFPHAVMLHGHTGAGKSTMAGICARELGCKGKDLQVINCAAMEKPIEEVRFIKERLGMRARYGDCRVFILEEVQALSRAGFAQQALLDMLESTPRGRYFLLCTTDPNKVLPAIRSRCTEVKCRALTEAELQKVLVGVAQQHFGSEGDRKFTDKVFQRIAECADGSARKALVILNQVMNLDDEGAQLDAIVRSDTRKQSIDLARLLMGGRKVDWKAVTAILSNIEDDPETVRRTVLGYARKILLSKYDKRAYLVIQAFMDDYFSSGPAGLVASCFSLFDGN